MKISLKGRVKSLENMIGSIECEEYNETYYFIKSDIENEYRNIVKKGDLVYFELKNNKSRRSKAYRISLKKNKDKKATSLIKINNLGILNIFERKKKEKEENSSFNIEKKEENIDQIKIKFKEFATENFIKLESNNKELNNLIKLVVKDNIITETEKIFLSEKINELNPSKIDIE